MVVGALPDRIDDVHVGAHGVHYLCRDEGDGDEGSIFYQSSVGTIYEDRYPDPEDRFIPALEEQWARVQAWVGMVESTKRRAKSGDATEEEEWGDE